MHGFEIGDEIQERNTGAGADVDQAVPLRGLVAGMVGFCEGDERWVGGTTSLR